MSVFEFTIRFVDGLLSIYALTGDEVSLVAEKRRRRRRRRKRCKYYKEYILLFRYSNREL